MSVSNTSLKALNILVHSPVTQDMIHKLVVATLQVLPCQDSKDSSKYPSPPTSPGEIDHNKSLPSLMTFLTKLVRYTNIYTGTLMATLVYLNRLKNKLPKNAQGLPCTRHRILLSCLILSSKNHNDTSPKNIHWAKYTDGLFSVKDINLMERQLLYLLNWDLRVSNEEMCQNLSKFLEPIEEDLIKSQKMRRYLKQQQQIQQEQQQQQQQQQQNICMPSPTRRSSQGEPRISRSSSTCSNLSLLHHSRQDSTSSISSQESSPDANSVSKQRKMGYPQHQVDPRIELTALNEEMELNRMLDLLSKSKVY